jgi:hypothetical protein
MNRLSIAGALGVVWFVLSTPAAANDIQTRPVHFKNGENAARIKGQLKGRQTIDYTLRARAGQTMTVTFSASNPSAYFNVMPPGSAWEALFVGSTEGNVWTGALPAEGEYRIRTYLYRNAARRNETTRFTLTLGIADSPLGTALPTDAKVKGTSYHATAAVPCSIGAEAPGSRQCEFGVIRGAPGNAEIHLTYFNLHQYKRVLTFMGDKVSADGIGAVSASKSGDIWLIEVNDYERYQIPAAVISGG